MECDECGDERVASINAKCSDLFFLNMKEVSVENDYVPSDWGIGGGDYVQFDYCLNCGKIQGDFPLEVTDLEMESEEEDEPDYSDEWAHQEDESEFDD